MVSGSLDFVSVKKFVVVGLLWRVEVGTDHIVKKVSWWLYPGGGYILSEILFYYLHFVLVLLTDELLFFK